MSSMIVWQPNSGSVWLSLNSQRLVSVNTDDRAYTRTELYQTLNGFDISESIEVEGLNGLIYLHNVRAANYQQYADQIEQRKMRLACLFLTRAGFDHSLKMADREIVDDATLLEAVHIKAGLGEPIERWADYTPAEDYQPRHAEAEYAGQEA